MARTRLRGLEIGGIQIGIEVPDTWVWEWPEGGLTDFACLPREPEVHVGIRVGDVARGDLGGERYALGVWTFEVGRRGEDWILGLSRAGHRERLACFDAQFRTGEIVVSRESAHRTGYPLQGPLDEWIVLHRTVSRGGLCLTANAVSTRGRADLRLGVVASGGAARWITPGSTLFGANSLLLREVEGTLRVFRTPWGQAMAAGLGLQARVGEVFQSEPSDRPYRDWLDPDEAADLLVKHAVVPLCDDGLFEQVLRNARRIADRVRILRVGEPALPSRVRVGVPPRLQTAFASPLDPR